MLLVWHAFFSLAVQSGDPKDVRPFFTDSYKGVSEESNGFGDFCQDSLIGVPIHYLNDGSYSYMLTPAVSPPSVDSVLEWLALEEKGRGKKICLIFIFYL